MKFRGYSANGVAGDACWFCEGCKRIHVLPYRIGRTRHVCHACMRDERAKNTGSLKLNTEHRAERVCLMCDKKFKSTDKANRRCAPCEYKLQHDSMGRHSKRNPLYCSARGKMFEVLPFLE